MRSGILLLVVVLALAALAALLWWRFKGSGLPAAPAATATRNHHSLRTFHYAPAGAIPKAAVSAEAAAAGAALASLLPPEDLEAPAAAGQLPEEAAPAAGLVDSPQATSLEESEATPEPAPEEAPRLASIRHAAGAVAVLLDAVDESPSTVSPAAQPASDPDEEPAEALFHNPITAPAPTANDQAKRAAEIALRQQRRARMSKDAAAQRAALNDLFPGAGSPVPTAKPS